MLQLVALVRTGVSKEHIASIIKVIRIRELVTTLAVTRNRRKLRRNNMYYTISSQRTSVASYCYRCSELAYSCQSDEGDYTFLRNVTSCKNHTA
jgi:hypothetical protein